MQFQIRCEECLKKPRVFRVETNKTAIMNIPAPGTKRDFFVVFLARPRSNCERIPKSLCSGIQDRSGESRSSEPAIPKGQFGLVTTRPPASVIGINHGLVST
jgi:hypothetical protein